MKLTTHLLPRHSFGGIRIQALLLAAGKGSRFKPLSDRIPKPLFHCSGRPIIQHLISAIIESGINDILIGSGWKSPLLQEFIKSGMAGATLRHVDVPDYHYGPLRTFTQTSDKLRNDPFVLCPADLITMSGNIKKVASSYSDDEVLLSLAVDPDSNRGTGVFVDNNGFITGVGKEGAGHYLGSSAQILVSDKRFIDTCLQFEQKGFATISDVIAELAIMGMKMNAVPIRDYWCDIDTPHDLLSANRQLLAGAQTMPPERVYVPPCDAMEFGEAISLSSGIQIQEGTKIIGPALVLQRSKIGRNVVIGPNVSISEDIEIGNASSIQNTIVFGGGGIEKGLSYSDAIVFDGKVIRG